MDKTLVNGVISKLIFKRAEKCAQTLDWYCILPENRLLQIPFSCGLLLMTIWNEDDCSNDENISISMVKHPKLQATEAKKPLAPANRFETVATSRELASFSEFLMFIGQLCHMPYIGTAIFTLNCWH